MFKGGSIIVFRKRVLAGSVGAALAALSGGAAASGFALVENGASGMGNAYAGGAAIAEDASTVYFNPAGMSRLQGSQLVVAAHEIGPSAQFSNTGSQAAALRPLGTATGDALGWTSVPNAYFVTEINPKTRFGFGVSVPFGLQTEYAPGWVGRFQALQSSVQTVNLNPSLSYQLNDGLSIGGGLNYQRIRAGLTSAQSFAALGEGYANMSGSDAAWGYNLGALYETASGARFGVAYRSSLSYKLSGTMLVTDPTGAVALNTAATADFKTPDTLSLSYFRPLNQQWDVMADLTRTGWSSFQELRILQASTGGLLQVTPENWRNTWRVAIGSSYHYSAQWTARIGLAYDQTPVSNAFRTARIPDSNRVQIAAGGQYKPSKDNVVDFGYTHLFMNNAAINNNTGSTGTPSATTVGTLLGNYSNSVDILSVQYAHNF